MEFTPLPGCDLQHRGRTKLFLKLRAPNDYWQKLQSFSLAFFRFSVRRGVPGEGKYSFLKEWSAGFTLLRVS
jgi:hypothetical protein